MGYIHEFAGAKDDGYIEYLKSLNSDTKIALLHKCMLAGVIVAHEANAETFEYTMDNVTLKDKKIGNYKITIKKVGKWVQEYSYEDTEPLWWW